MLRFYKSSDVYLVVIGVSLRRFTLLDFIKPFQESFNFLLSAKLLFGDLEARNLEQVVKFVDALKYIDVTFYED